MSVDARRRDRWRHRGRSLAAAKLSATLVPLLLPLVPSVAMAQLEAAGPVDGPPPAAPPDPVAWSEDWPRFRWWEYAGSAAVGATSWYFRNYRLPPAQPKWYGDNGFDDAFRGWLRADTPAGRRRAHHISDRLSEIGYAIPFALDVPLAWLTYEQPGLAWQMTMTNLEAFAVAGLINNVLFYEVGRARPSARDCAADPAYDDLCGIGANASMPSGHVLTLATGAGLTCVHHHYLPLYGSRLADAGACAIMVALAVTNSAFRIMADRHYATDDLAGIAVGFGTGYALPWLLHYRYGAHGTDASRDGHRAAASPHVALIPWADRDRLGLGVAGLL